MEVHHLTLYTANLDETVHFYGNTLGLEVLNHSKDEAEFRIGSSVLNFTYDRLAVPYHFAINIPCNKVVQAESWLRDRVRLLPDGNNDVIEFGSWNATSMYFYDPSRNIVELIARKNTAPAFEDPFNQFQLLRISEIGMPVTNIARAYRLLHEMSPLPIYDGDFDRFCAAGDENGLFIIIDRNKKAWYPTNDLAYSADFILQGDYSFAFYDGEIQGRTASAH